MSCSIIQKTIGDYGSRGAIQGLVDHVQQLLSEADDLNTSLTLGTSNAEVNEQYRIHLTYVQQVGVVTEDFRLYKEARVGDATTRAGSERSMAQRSTRSSHRDQPFVHGRTTHSPHNPQPHASPLVRLHDIPSQQQSQRSSSPAESQHSSRRSHPSPHHGGRSPFRPRDNSKRRPTSRRRDSTSEELKEAEKALEKLKPIGKESEGQEMDGRRTDINRWCQEQQRQHDDEHQEELAPDGWINVYQNQVQTPRWTTEGKRSTIKAELGYFGGQALQWFTWIDLFRALVHDTGRTAAENLAILRRHLRGDCADIVYGLGGGDSAYIEALCRLKETYGRRDVMRAAILQALGRLEIGKGDPSFFRRFAEKTRTYLFDLNRIDEAASADVIERVCLKLQLPDRLAWNEGRGSGMEKRSLLTFGQWLCGCAAAFQNAHSLAAEQIHSHSGKQQHRPFVQTHSTSTGVDRRKSTPKWNGGGGNWRGGGKPFCFRCEGSHRLETCGEFKSLSTKDRLFFCIRRKLCFICFWASHSSRDCNSKKPCSFPGCKHWHHPLLHEETEVPVTEVRPTTALANSLPGMTAVAMIHLDILDTDGRAVRANVFVDEGSDSTLFSEGFIRRLRLVRESETLAVDGAGAIRSNYLSQRVSIKLRLPSGDIVTVVGSTMPTVASPVPMVDWSKLKVRWKHLEDLPIEPSGGRVDILLGSDVVHMTTAIESRIRRDYEPTACRTRLGWIVRGAIGSWDSSRVVRSHTIFSTSNDVDLLSPQIKRFCDTEDFGTEYQRHEMSEAHR